MNDELADVLEAEHRYASDAQVTDAAEAAAARAAGDMPRAFDLSTYLALADVSWALEDWPEARRWYAHNAAVLAEARAWHHENSGPDYPLEAASDWEAATLVKAGRVDEGRDHLTGAIAYRRGRPGSEQVVAHLALHAAQVGSADLASLVEAGEASRQGARVALADDDPAPQLVRAHLHYEPVQARLLLGDWSGFRSSLELLEGEARLLGDDREVAPPAAEQPIVAAARGFRAISSLEAGTIGAAIGARDAREAFESAMLAFYRAEGWMAPELYFMRLNVVLADQLAEGQPINPNPFAALM